MNLDKSIALSDLYKMLLLLYEKVSDLSTEILHELERERSENSILSLLEQKKVAGEAIKQMTEKIASTEIKSKTDTNLKTLAEVKSLLQQITEKTKLIQEVEERTQKLIHENDCESK